MATSDPDPVVLHADPEHARLRTAVAAFLLIALLVVFGLARLLIGRFGSEILRDFSIVVSCATALSVGLAAAWLFERRLKNVWHSGEQLQLDAAGIHYHVKPNDNTQTFHWSAPMNVLYWTFKLSGYPRAGRERRLPKQWICLACELQQDEERLSVFTYAPPQRAARWTQAATDGDQFIALSLNKLYAGQRLSSRYTAVAQPKVTTDLLRGKDGRFWLAEQRRWQQGIELTPDDFETFIDYVRRKQQDV
jgi:hypothetical protein